MKPGDVCLITQSSRGNEGKRCKLIERYDRLVAPGWWVQILDGSGREGLLPEEWMQAVPEQEVVAP